MFAWLRLTLQNFTDCFNDLSSYIKFFHLFSKLHDLLRKVFSNVGFIIYTAKYSKRKQEVLNPILSRKTNIKPKRSRYIPMKIKNKSAPKKSASRIAFKLEKNNLFHYDQIKLHIKHTCARL